MRWREFPGSCNSSLYCGRSILPSPFFVLGYDKGFRSSAMSKLPERTWAGIGDGPSLDSIEFCLLRLSWLLWREREFFFLLIVSILGKPNSSSSSSPYTISSSSSSGPSRTSQLPTDEFPKFEYGFRSGDWYGCLVADGVGELRLDEIGGVCGREDEPSDRESNLSISAWEYEAPMTLEDRVDCPR